MERHNEIKKLTESRGGLNGNVMRMGDSRDSNCDECSFFFSISISSVPFLNEHATRSNLPFYFIFIHHHHLPTFAFILLCLISCCWCSVPTPKFRDASAQPLWLQLHHLSLSLLITFSHSLSLVSTTWNLELKMKGDWLINGNLDVEVEIYDEGDPYA